jgi:ArsR family transcriptional regulator
MRELTKTFKALSDRNRIRILKMLEIKPLCVCEITEVLELATSTVSKHLSILRDVELIIDEKDGKWVIYRLNHQENNEYVKNMLPLLKSWLDSDNMIKEDQVKVRKVDRNIICGL